MSPDKKLIAYSSDHSGRYEVYVRPLETPEPTIQVSSGTAAAEPHWSHDGTTLFFAGGASSVHAVAVSRNHLRVSEARTESYVVDRVPSAGDRQTFAPLTNGRIVYIRDGDQAGGDHFVVRQDWRSLLPEAGRSK